MEQCGGADMLDWKDVRRYGQILEDENTEINDGYYRRTKFWFNDMFVVVEMLNGKCIGCYETEK